MLKAAKNAARRMALRGKASAEAGQTAELRGDGGKMGKYFGGLDLGGFVAMEWRMEQCAIL